MARRPETRPTLIYWLYDMRPEALDRAGKNGRPFYCGKTIETLKRRLRSHFKDARRWPNRETAKVVNACGEQYLRIQLVDTVECEGDWVAKEKLWIALLRNFHSSITNIASGGQGPTGYIPSDEQRERSRQAMLGNTNAKGSKYSLEIRAAMSEQRKGRKASPETRAKMSLSHRGSPSQEERERISAALRGRPHSAERKEAIRAGRERKKLERMLTIRK